MTVASSPSTRVRISLKRWTRMLPFRVWDCCGAGRQRGGKYVRILQRRCLKDNRTASMAMRAASMQTLFLPSPYLEELCRAALVGGKERADGGDEVR